MLKARNIIYTLPFSAFETVGFETITALTLGAFVMAPKCTIPIRPHPITPTLTSLGSFSCAAMDKVDRDESLKCPLVGNVNVNASTLRVAQAAKTRKDVSLIFSCILINI